MNYLAHLSLSYPIHELMVGNYIKDLVKKKTEKEIPIQFHRGMEMHKWIDQYTDQDPRIQEMKSIFKVPVGKYAPVAVDIICDYFLYKNWTQFNEKTFDLFERQVYEILNSNRNSMPELISTIMQKMSEGNFLKQYKSIEGLNSVFVRMNNKAKFSVDFTLATHVVQSHQKILDELFLEFYSELKMEAKNWLIPQNEEKL